MARSKLRFAMIATALCLAANACKPATKPNAQPTMPDLTGMWLMESCPGRLPSTLVRTKLVVDSGSFALSGYWGVSEAWVGDYAIDGSRNFDLHTRPFHIFRDTIPASTIHGIYKLNGGRLTVCFPEKTDAPRPADFTPGDNVTVATLVRADPGYKDFPADVAVTVLDPSGHPVVGAEVFAHAAKDHGTRPSPDGAGLVYDPASPIAWRYSALAKTGPDGVAHVSGDAFDAHVVVQPSAAHDPATEQVGFAAISPAILQHGTLTIHLAPTRTIRGTITCDALTRSGSAAPNRTAYLFANSMRPLFCWCPNGAFDFHVPPGTYELDARGADLKEAPRQTVIVSADGTGDVVVPPIDLTPSTLRALIGRPAPELTGVRTWANGGPVRLADLHGKVVLLDFWGYWCGPCVVEMPALMRVATKYTDRGLAVVSVHVDADGSVDTAAKLEAKMAPLVAGPWHGARLPFPVALVDGTQPRDGKSLPTLYGVLNYPTMIVVARDGQVREDLRILSDDKDDEVDAVIEKLLAAK